MTYIQKNDENTIIAMTESDSQPTTDINGEWIQVEESDIIKAANGKLYFKQIDEDGEAEIKKLMKQAELAEMEAYLASTDYVTNKIVESGLSLADFLAVEGNAKYAAILEEREKARERIGELREELES